MNLTAQKLISFADLGQFKPTQNYNFQKVEDIRTNQSKLGIMVDGVTQKRVEFNVEKGLSKAIEALLIKNEDAQKQIIFKVKTFELFEKAINLKQTKGDFWITVQFFTLQEKEEQYLTEYSYSSTYTRATSNINSVQETIKKGLFASFTNFETWFVKNNLKSDKLASKVFVSVSDLPMNTPDTLIYDLKRKLKWSDFKGKPSLTSKYAATIFSSFGYQALAKVERGVIRIDTKVWIYMVPNMSWVKSDTRTDYGLAHEQAHFNITKLIAEEFKTEIRTKTFSTVDWQSELQYEYISFFQKLGKIQAKYDDETAHGINEANQKEWMQKIEKKLGELGN